MASERAAFGDAETVASAVEQLPEIFVLCEGPELRLVWLNTAGRAVMAGRQVEGRPFREAFGDLLGPRWVDDCEEAYRGGRRMVGRESRVRHFLPDGTANEVFVNFTFTPWRAPDGSVRGVLGTATDVTASVLARHAAEQRDPRSREVRGTPTDVTARRSAEQRAGVAERRAGVAEQRAGVAEQRAGVAEQRAGVAEERAGVAEQQYAQSRESVLALQAALLPTALPVLPQTRLAARYVLADIETAAGGDWFDAVVLDDGRVGLVLGDVVGHGVAASAVMGQLRAVLAERLTSGAELGAVLARLDEIAERTPGAADATVCVAVLDPATGDVEYGTCGHPPPLIVAPDGRHRYLEATGAGPLGTGTWALPQTATLNPDEVLALYSDGLVERSHRSWADGLDELGRAAAGAAANPGWRQDAPFSAAERVAQQSMEILTGTGYTDDVTLLVAERLSEPRAGLQLPLPADADGVPRSRHAVADWLATLEVTTDDQHAIQICVTEAVTNAVEHAYRTRPGATRPATTQPRTVTLHADIEETGALVCTVTDDGRWRPPSPDPGTRGRGLAMISQLTDAMTVDHTTQGTTITMRRRLHHSAVLVASSIDSAAPAARRPAPATAFSITSPDTDTAAERATLVVTGPLDAGTAGMLDTQIRRASRGGVAPIAVDLSPVTLLASAGVRVLDAHARRASEHGQPITLITRPNTIAHQVLTLAQLPSSTSTTDPDDDHQPIAR